MFHKSSLQSRGFLRKHQSDLTGSLAKHVFTEKWLTIKLLATLIVISRMDLYIPAVGRSHRASLSFEDGIINRLGS